MMDLAVDLRTYVAGRRDSKQEQTLLRRIRSLPQPQRMEVLAPLLKTHWREALFIADRAQLSRSDYRAIFKQGLAEGDASSIKLWMKATVGHVGWRWDPPFASGDLTLWAMTVAAAVVRNRDTMGTARALIEMAAQCRGAAARNGQQHFDMPPTNPLVVSLDEGGSRSAD